MSSRRIWAVFYSRGEEGRRLFSGQDVFLHYYPTSGKVQVELTEEDASWHGESNIMRGRVIRAFSPTGNSYFKVEVQITGEEEEEEEVDRYYYAEDENYGQRGI